MVPAELFRGSSGRKANSRAVNAFSALPLPVLELELELELVHKKSASVRKRGKRVKRG